MLRSSPRFSFMPHLERLEDRSLLAAGLLDPTFGQGGKVLTTFPASTSAVAGAVAFQADDKIVVAGSSGGDFALARYNADGSLDSSFGSGGFVTTDFGNVDTATDVTVQPGGKILAVGNSTAPDLVFETAIARYLPSGQLDVSFGNGGKVVLGGKLAGHVALYPDGRILVEGETGSFLTTIHSLTLTRLNADGSPDTGFGTGGTAFINFSATASPAAAGAFLLLDGRIIATASGNGNALLARVNPDGSLDPSFGTQGETVTPLVTVYGSTQQVDGKILLAGAAQGSSGQSEFALLRYNVNGTLDSTLGGTGEVLTEFGAQSQASGVVIQADGRIVEAGTVQAADGDFALARLNPNGSLDTTFGSGGKTATDFGPLNELGNRVGLQADGKVVVVGGATGPFAVARYTAGDSVGDNNQRFISQAYLDLLGRSVDATGLASWTAALTQGVSRAQVVLDIESSPEFRGHVLQLLYGTYLHRPADPLGLAGFSAFLAAGGKVGQVQTAILGSPEYFQLHGGTNNGFVSALYGDLLNRGGDMTGSTAFQQALATGATRPQIATDLLASPEYQQDLVRALYLHFLRRPADPTGANGFGAALQAGARDELVAASIAASDEYFMLHL